MGLFVEFWSGDYYRRPLFRHLSWTDPGRKEEPAGMPAVPGKKSERGVWAALYKPRPGRRS